MDNWIINRCRGCMINLVDNLVLNKMPQEVYHLLELVE
jgi:hypothetical protein